jgi:hypothetical protein
VRRLLDDPATAALATGLLTFNSGIKRLADKEWMAVSAPQS